MSPKHAICFFSCVLLLMNGEDIDAREVKVKVQDQQEVDLSEAPVSSDEAYQTGYRTTSKPTSNHVPKHNHNHPSHHGNLNQPYITSYETSATHKANQPNYLVGYRTRTPDSNSPYIAGYQRNGAYETSQPYTTSYGSNQHDSDFKNAPKYSPQNEEPYITQYGVPSPKKETNYLIGYSTRTHDSNSPYIAGYRRNGAYETNQPYTTSYGSNQHDSDLKNAPKYSSQNVEPYITQYGVPGPIKEPKESSHDNEPYITQYRKNYPNNGLFVLDDFYVGNVMTLQFPIQEVSPFLPRKEAESIPFSMSQLPSVVQLFSIPEDSPQANAMRDTIQHCEAEPIRGETRTCVTSLESMLEFVATIIGSEAKYNILTTTYPTSSSVPLQNYTVLEVSKDINAPKWVACHPLNYPYAVYYCHFISTGTKVFKVLLGGENGDNKIEALGICHLDSSDWSPDHILFSQLGFKPGQAPVCHFFPINHLIWVPQPSEATM